MPNPVSRTIGNLKSFTKTDSGILAEGSSGFLRITFFSDSIARVSLSPTNSFDDFSYAVVGQPALAMFSVVESPDSVQLNTPEFRVTISRSPIRVSFETLTGEVINEDDRGLGTSWIGDQVTTYKTLQEGERFIGLGEKTGHLDRRGSCYVNWTTDAYAYHGGSDPLYCSTPFYIGLHHQLMYGIYFDNSFKTFFNFGASNNRFSSFAADCGPMNYYFIHGESIPSLLGSYTSLTGRMPLPPLWSLGYQQCRYSYYPDKEVMTLAQTFREKNIPADVIVLDIHYMDKYKIFTWDNKNFSDPKGLLKFLQDRGFKVVVMCDPGIKVEDGYAPYEAGKQDKVFLQYPDGENYTGQVWPGWCHFPDFTNPATRTWWKNQLKFYTDLGLEGFWNDMNEIATWGHALPENIEFDFDGNKGTTRQGRNLFGFQMARSTYEGTRELLNGKRPFNLTRSGFSGVQRYAAVWTGDNVSYDDHMLLGVRLVNSMGLTGIAFAGYDAGGFVGEAGTKLFARWISIAALSPFFRGHTMINTRDAEPWSFGEEVEQIARNFIRLRYQLMPYIYSLFNEAAGSGMPVQRSLAIEHPFDELVYHHAYQNQYMFGPHILVAPLESTREVVKVYFPAGDWYSVYTGELFTGNIARYIEAPIHRLPIFVRAGAVIPMRRAGINTAAPTDELVIHLYYASNAAPTTFAFYEDDGETFAFENAAFSKRSLIFNSSERKLTITKQEGSFASPYRTLKVVLHGFDEVKEVRTVDDGNIYPVSAIESSFFTPIEKYDPIHDPEWMGSETIQETVVKIGTEELQITF
jgi:alpha-glucosidase